MPIATRLSTAGTLLVNGSFDEKNMFIADALVIGGGAAGGHLGGGGAGGHRYFTDQPLAPNTNYTVTVGAGGTASTGATGNAGSNSVFDTYTAAGGGGGAGEAALPAAGGSGGGGGGVAGTSRPGAAGNTPSTSPSQGNTGGNGNDNGAGTVFAGGGGGGAGSAGFTASTVSAGGIGGLGTANSITGSSVTRAGGGGGGAYSNGATGTSGPGGSSIGGNGGRNGLNATGGTPNTGSGGGGNGYTSAGNLQGSSGAGGSGVVILKYPNIFSISNSGGGLTFTTDSSSVAGYNITTLTAGTGQISFAASTKFRTTSNTVFASEFDEFTGAPVVDSSLKLWLDAGQTASYSGSGTTWTDLSGNGNNGTLVNSPTFISNDGGGCIQLDGTNDHITLPVTGFAPASLTIDYWIKRISDNGYFWLIDNSDQPELRMLFQAGKLQIYFYDDGAYLSTSLSTTTFSTGSWYNITVTLTNGSQNVYINGNQEIITTTGVYTGGPSGNAGEHTLGTYNRPGVGYGGYANIRIGSYRFYNRALTAAEVIQNYNALQSRYGLASITATQMPVVQRQQSSGTLLVNGEFDEFTGAPVVDSSLQLWLDAGQTTSYPGSGTTWADLSGNGRTGTLTSGPTFSATNGGSIGFNGTSNYVQCTGSLTVTAATFVAWIRRSGTQIPYSGIIYSRGTGSNVSGLGIGQTGTTNQIGYTWHNQSSSYFFTTNLTIPDLTWCMIAVSVTSTAATFYLCQSSGITTATNTTSHPSTVLDDIKIAQDEAVGDRFFKGNIAAAQIYNKALTADEITTNFNALRGRYGI